MQYIRIIHCSILVITIGGAIHSADPSKPSQSTAQVKSIWKLLKLPDIAQIHKSEVNYFTISDIDTIGNLLYIVGEGSGKAGLIPRTTLTPSFIHAGTNKKIVILECIPSTVNTGIKNFEIKPFRVYEKPYNATDISLIMLKGAPVLSMNIDDRTHIYETPAPWLWWQAPELQERSFPHISSNRFSLVGSYGPEYWACTDQGCILFKDNIKISLTHKPTVVGLEPKQNGKTIFWSVEDAKIQTVTIDHQSAQNPTLPSLPFTLEEENTAGERNTQYSIKQLLPYDKDKACALGTIKDNTKSFLLFLQLKEELLKYSILPLDIPEDITKIAIGKDSKNRKIIYALMAPKKSNDRTQENDITKSIKVASLDTLITRAKKNQTMAILQAARASLPLSIPPIPIDSTELPIPTTTTEVTPSVPPLPAAPQPIITTQHPSIATSQSPNISEEEEDAESEESSSEENQPIPIIAPIPTIRKKIFEIPDRSSIIIINQETGPGLDEDKFSIRVDGTRIRRLELSSSILRGVLTKPEAHIEHVFKTKNNIYLLVKTAHTLDTYKRHLRAAKNIGWQSLGSKKIPDNAKILGMNPSTKKINIQIADCAFTVSLRFDYPIEEPADKTECRSPHELYNVSEDVIIKSPEFHEKTVASKTNMPNSEGLRQRLSTFMQTKVWQPIKNFFLSFFPRWNRMKTIWSL